MLEKIPEIGQMSSGEIEQQDMVDNVLYEAAVTILKETAAIHGIDLPQDYELEWDQQYLAQMRDGVEAWLVTKLGLITDMQLYPYFELKEDSAN